ncbi:hypothetical protein M9Y10_020697 [Tritrichomonas musculus]|uniref:Peptidase S8/S53 domain-containing protein n=1 Tax=Tritrichomonas musculus TaxID=1915356 RepID=A0ABR2HFB6_9EUKA
MLLAIFFIHICGKLSSFRLLTSTKKEFDLINTKNYLIQIKEIKKHNFSSEEEHQFSWYYVHFLTDNLNEIRDKMSIEGKDLIMKNTYALYLSTQQISLISDISLIKKIEAEDKFYEDDCPIEDTNYLIITTCPNYQLPTHNDIYKIENQDLSNTFIVRIERGELNDDDFLNKKKKVIKFLTKLSEVKTVSTFSKAVAYNAIISGYIQKNNYEFKRLPNRGYYYLNRYMNDHGLNGEDEVITVLDTPIDFMHSMFRDDKVKVEVNTHMPNHRKIIYYGYDGTMDDLINEMYEDEHGTHTSATAAGKSICDVDVENISYFNGCAPEAKLVYAGYFNAVTARELQSLLVRYNSNVSTNSWGLSKYSPSYNYNYGRVAVSNPQVVLVFAAGNEYSNKGNFSIGDPQGSKEVLTVGAIDDFYNNPSYAFVRKEDMQELFIAQRFSKTSYLYVEGTIGKEGSNSKFLAIDMSKGNQCNLMNISRFIILYGEQESEWIYECNYSVTSQVYLTTNKTAVEKILSGKGTKITTLPRFSMNETHTVRHASYSSTGPAHYGILKPDVVAIGTQVISAKSNAKSQQAHGCLENYDGDFRMMDGTSMATPNVAGSAALIHQYFRSGNWIDKVYINGATNRALIINSCRHPYDSKIPDIVYGHGVVDLSTILPVENDFGVAITRQEESMKNKFSVVANGHVVTCISVNKSINKKLQITLSYLDPLLQQDSMIPITHDLDLVVTSPSKKMYLGDHLENNDSQHASTNEKVIINEDELEDGEYKIHVFASVFIDTKYSPEYRQDFSLVASGPIKNGYLEFEDSKECLCDKCDPSHPGNCLCDESQAVGPICQAKIETSNDNVNTVSVGSLLIKRVMFHGKGNITSVVSRSKTPGRDATVWVSPKCHLILAEYEVNGQTGNETSGDEKKINIQFGSNEICVAIFNNNDRAAEYTIEVTVEDDGDGETSQISSEIESTQISSEIESTQISSEIESTQISSEIESTQISSEIESTQISSEIESTQISSEIESIQISSEIESTQISSVVDSDSPSFYSEFDSYSVYSAESSGGDDSDDGNNEKKNKKKAIIIGVVAGLMVAVVAVVVFVFITKRGYLNCCGSYRQLETTTSKLSSKLI